MPYPYKSITSPQNETVKHLARLAQSSRDRRREGVMLLEGIHLLQSCLEQGVEPLAVYVNDQSVAHAEVSRLLQVLSADCDVIAMPDAVLAKASALASAPELLTMCRRPEAGQMVAGESCVLLEDLQDPGNIGTILRGAAASGVRSVWLSKGCADVYSPKVLRAGMGAHFVLDIHEQADLASAIRGFAGRRLVTHLEGSVSLYAEDLSGPVALVFGNEGAGVSEALVALADARVRIPMPGHAESLNVAMAATVCLFERVRQCEAKAGR